ncbi:HNH endonuclease [Shewanella sp. A3A]|nr:HNH endonuclease [Shewanella ferrihydritica]
MKLNVDFSALYRAISPLGDVTVDFNIESIITELDSIAEHLRSGLILGEDIQLAEIDGSTGILNYKNHQILLYIPDQGTNIINVLEDGKQKWAKRVHFAECKTIIGMREKGRFKDRYDVTNRIDGLFTVFGIDSHTRLDINGEANLAVCQNCLSLINYHNFQQLSWNSKQNFVNNFSFVTLFETYSSYFKSIPKSQDGYQSSGYTDDWSDISSKIRKELNYTCEQCGLYLQQHTRLLHVHHINGNKSQNIRTNLRALCADCHKRQPHHGHLYVSHEDTLKINQLRREQHKFDVYTEGYEQLFRYADTALNGLITKCKSVGIPCGELGIGVNSQEKYISIDLCWPRRKVAVVIDTTNYHLLTQLGWTVFSAFNALQYFEDFQSKVR